MPVGAGAVEVAADGDRRYGDHRAFEQPRLRLVVLPFAGGEAESPAVVVDDDVDMVAVVKRGGGAVVPPPTVGAPLVCAVSDINAMT